MQIADFYDGLAPYYHLIYLDWEASSRRQADVLDGVIQDTFGPRAQRVLDAACGIGTQALGLAQLGYTVTAADISREQLERGSRESRRLGLSLDFRLADMRSCDCASGAPFDVVLACDNAIPHLQNDDQILAAFTAFHRATMPQGGCIVSVRDYAAMTLGGTQVHPRVSHRTGGGRVTLVDVWEFEGEHYDLTMYIVEDNGGSVARTRVLRGGRYYCVTLDRLQQLMQEAGFGHTKVLRDRFFQPLLLGLKSGQRSLTR